MRTQVVNPVYVIGLVLLSVLGSVLAVNSAISSGSGRQVAWYEAPFLITFVPEVLIGVFMLCYCGNIYLGKKANDKIALAFGHAFCEEEGLLDRNFSQVGPRIGDTDDVILRESMNKYSIYATGRRFCKGFSATLDLRHRQDLMFLASYLINPSDDHLDIEIPMNDSNMQPMVLLIAPHHLAKKMAKNLPDVQNFALPTVVGKDRLPTFPTNKLTVFSETQALFYDIMTEQAMELLFSRAAFKHASKYFRYLHFSTENPEGSTRQSLKFSFLLPPKEQLQDLLKCLTAVLYFIDVVGSHQLTLEQREKATKRRSKLQALMGKSKAREQQEAFQLKKLAKYEEEKEKLKRMNPEQRAKQEAKNERILMNRAMKKRMVRA